VKEYDPDGLSHREKERRKKLISGMFAELKKCESEDCYHIAEEAKRNRKNLEKGTESRNLEDRMKFMRVLEYCCML
jgi:hypothetical protein